MELVDLKRGLVSRRIFSDEEIHRLEMERIFHGCWLFLGHESMIPRAGGKNPTISSREEGKIVCGEWTGGGKLRGARCFLIIPYCRGPSQCFSNAMEKTWPTV